MLKSITSGLRRVFKSDAQDDDENQGRFSEILKWAETASRANPPN